MIQLNLLLGTVGKAPNSFIVMDLMRLPLGILTGMGFIGGGAILRKGNLVHGVTTAATLWFVTVMGLCFGGGQNGLGLAALALGLVALIGLKQLEYHFRQDRQAALTLVAGHMPPSEMEVTNAIMAAGFKIVSSSVTLGEHAALLEINYEIKWRARVSDIHPADFLKELAVRFGLAKTEWRIVG